MEEVYKASARDPNRWRNNPEKKRKALEGLGKLLDEWEAENGPFTAKRNSPEPAPACMANDHRPGYGSPDSARPR